MPDAFRAVDRGRAVPWHHHYHFLAECSQRPGQRPEHLCEASGFRERSRFRRHH